VLKGNFETEKTVQVDETLEEKRNSLETRYEHEAVMRLGGSLAFTRKKKVLWQDEE